MRRIEIYDTTLRDGAQAERIDFSLFDKLALTERLDGLGVDYIEGGYPACGPGSRRMDDAATEYLQPAVAAPVYVDFRRRFGERRRCGRGQFGRRHCRRLPRRSPGPAPGT